MHKLTAVFTLVLVATVGCNMPEMPLPGITGKAGELVVVMDENLWKGEAGDTVFNTLSQHVYGLPQPEPMFNVVHIKSAAFTKIFQTHRNIVYVNIGSEYQTSIELKTDVWADPQVVVDIKANSVDEFLTIFGDNAQKIIGHVLKTEQARTHKSYSAQKDGLVTDAINEKFGVEMTIPKGYVQISDQPNFTWLRHDTKDIAQNIVIYTEPYSKDNTFTQKGMMEVINAFSEKHIPGPDPGTYMSLYEEYPPSIKEITISDKYATKLAGLWNVERALMGGPFICYAFLDESETKVHYLYGFVFAPGKKKRNYMRQVDAILASAKL